MKSLFVSLALLAAVPAMAQDKPAVSAKPLFTEALAHVPGQRLTAVEVTFPPGAVSAPHHHAGAVYVHVLQGAVRSQLNDGPAKIYQAGESFFEPPGTHHMHSSSASATEPARILAVFIAPDGATLTTYDK